MVAAPMFSSSVVISTTIESHVIGANPSPAVKNPLLQITVEPLSLGLLLCWQF